MTVKWLFVKVLHMYLCF